MITYFTEQDLVSFGNFILSPTRKKAYLVQEVPETKIDEVLETVNPFDLTAWFNSVIKAQKEAVPTQEGEPITNEIKP